MERNEISMLVARNIEAVMDQKGLNAAQVAKRAGLSPSGIYDIMYGRSQNPRIDTLHRIAVRGLEVPLAQLFMEVSESTVDDDLDATLPFLHPDDRRRLSAIAKAFLQQDADDQAQPSPSEVSRPSDEG